MKAIVVLSAALLVAGMAGQLALAQQPIPVAASKLPPIGSDKALARADCTAAKLGSAIPVSAIGEPVAAVTLNAPVWVEAAGELPAYCSVDGAMAPVDKSPTAKPINFRVLLPASWNHRAAQIGGGGMNGTIPVLTGLSNTFGGITPPLQRGFATYGSDSGHQAGMGGGRGAAPAGRGPANPDAAARGSQGMDAGGRGLQAMNEGARGQAGRGNPGGAPQARGAEPAGANDWSTNDEAIKNLGYMQMKKTHDAAMVIIEKAYGEKPRYNYWFGGSQGGREGVTVAQRYPEDYDGIVVNVPIVSFSSLMLGPELVLIHQKPAANWVTPAKMNAIRTELMRQCDKLDGLADAVINNYMACRAFFDLSEGTPNRHPWVAKRCPNNVDPNPADTSAAACLTDGQISTLEFVFTRYPFTTPLANGLKTFGMWAPTTEPSGTALANAVRYRGQEGAAADAPVHTSLGVLGVTGFLLGDPASNPLDYVEGGKWNARREQLSQWLDSTNPDLSRFYKRGGKLIVTIGTNDTVAPSGAQLDYYQSVLDKMGRQTVDSFARMYVLPQGGHGVTGNSYTVDGDGQTVKSFPLSAKFDRIAVMQDWVEKNIAPGKVVTIQGSDRTSLLCSYPSYPKYNGGPAEKAESYSCVEK